MKTIEQVKLEGMERIMTCIAKRDPDNLLVWIKKNAEPVGGEVKWIDRGLIP